MAEQARCPRCGGAMVPNHDGASCLACGHAAYRPDLGELDRLADVVPAIGGFTYERGFLTRWTAGQGKQRRSGGPGPTRRARLARMDGDENDE